MSSAVEGAFWMSAAPRFQTGRGAYPISPRVRTIPAYRRVRTIPVAPGVVRTLEFMDRRGNPNLEFMDRRGNPNPTGPWLIHMCPRSGPRVIRALSSSVARGCLLLRLTADHWTTRVVQWSTLRAAWCSRWSRSGPSKRRPIPELLLTFDPHRDAAVDGAPEIVHLDLPTCLGQAILPLSRQPGRRISRYNSAAPTRIPPRLDSSFEEQLSNAAGSSLASRSYGRRTGHQDATKTDRPDGLRFSLNSEADATEAHKLLRDALKKAVKVEWP